MKSLMTRWKLDPLYPNPFSPAKRNPCYVSLLGKAILKMEKIERQEGRPVIPQTSAKSTEVLCCLGNIIPIQADDNPPNILPHRVPDAYVKVHLVCDFGLDFCFLGFGAGGCDEARAAVGGRRRQAPGEGNGL